MGYYDLGSYECRVTTTSKKAQKWFNRGLIWTYGYHHEEAVLCFKKAIKHDPDCGMAHWGLAYASGPNYNMAWDLFDDAGRAEALAISFDATQTAMACLDGATPHEIALISALPHRYPQRDVAPIDQMNSWNDAFADAMRAAFNAHPQQLDIRTVFVESLLNRFPWNMWDIHTGQPTPGANTPEAQEVCETALAADPNALRHPGLTHLYVHLMEMSPTPEKALKAGDALRRISPDAGHLIHMPTHIDVQCGNYHDVVDWNETAATADMKYFDREGPYNIYTGYRAHNLHFVIYGAMFLGQMAPAFRAAALLKQTIPEKLLRIESPPMADYFESFVGFEPHIYVRFGQWRKATQLDLPTDAKLYCTLTANTRYARAIGHAALGEVDQALQEQQAFLAACEAVPDTRLVHNNTVVDLLEVGKAMLEGEIAYRKGAFPEAFDALREATKLEDNLHYDEPWGWMQPTRHALGALLFEQGHVDEAKAVFREDLGLGGSLPRALVHPDNVWALKGLHDCLEKRADSQELPQIRARLALAQARADQPVKAPCGCAQAAMT
jgi:tetratricopeptide (TPR) repeat protein